MQVTVSNNIRITDPSPEIITWCQTNLKLANPDYAKKVRMGFWTGNTPKDLYLYEMHGGELVIPYGCLKAIAPLIKDATVQSDFKPSVSIDYGKHIPLYPYQETAVKACVDGLYGILQSKAGSGKGLPLSATIYTPHGKKQMGDLVVGDEVLNTYGAISKVTNVFDRGLQPCYEVAFDDGNRVICDSDHLWEVYTENGKKLVENTRRLYANGVNLANGRHKYRVYNSRPVYFDRQDIPIHPWLLGFLIGDGYFGNEITFSTNEQDLFERVSQQYVPGQIKPKDTSPYDYRIVDGGITKRKLTELGLLGHRSWEKFIPKCYKYNDKWVRLSLLQGLIDTDGSVKKTNTSITTTSNRLARDILEVIESLGGTGSCSTRQTHYTHNGVKKKGRTSYRIYFKLPHYLIPCSSNKHLSKYTPRTKYREMYRKIISITPCGEQVTRCISVDSDNELFLTNHFIPTHNTQMGIALIREHGKRALWLCHTLDLVKQSKERAERYMDKNLLGLITEGKVNIGSGITFATIQTMSKLDLAQYRDMWDVIIVDECHRVAGTPTAMTQFSKVLNSLSARHKYGLSATVHRSDGMIMATYALLGNVVYTVPDEAIADKVMRVGIKPIGTGVGISRECLNTDGTLNYTKLITYLCEDFTRTHIIGGHIVSESDKSCLILSDRLEHLEHLMNTLPRQMRDKAVMISGKMTSKKGKAEREQALEDMRTGEKKYLFATYSLAKEGLDIPCLERLFMVTPQKDYAVITQSIGRIARVCEGKAAPIVYDFVDNIGYLQKSFKKRCTTYKKNDCYFIGD